jgi:hypothetical protein
MQFITIEELGQLETLVFDATDKRTIEILLASINDWPKAVNSLEEYAIQVDDFIGGEVTQNNIMKTLKSIDHLKAAWQAESLTQLIEIFEYYDRGKTLSEIITVLTDSIRRS